MRIGILEAGKVDETLVARHGDYPTMFADLLRRADPTLAFGAFDVQAGVLPEDPRACDAWLITGSKHGVYDDLPWIAPLMDFIRAVRAAGVPIVGICFGHQIVAQALGGHAEKSERGWGVGVHRYRVAARPGWMAGGPDEATWHAHHQDQVTALPPDATVLAESGFCPYAALAYGDPEHPDAFTIQPHPEFATAYARDLLDKRTNVSVPEAIAAPARETYGQAVDAERYAAWVAAYLRATAARSAAA
ncbi:MAG: gamma-glutamyl-gamma-aminobutyrate hydrolase family protein [Pseudomonadota bacterium]